MEKPEPAYLTALRQRELGSIAKTARTRRGESTKELPWPRHYRPDGTPVTSVVSVTERQSHGQVWNKSERIGDAAQRASWDASHAPSVTTGPINRRTIRFTVRKDGIVFESVVLPPPERSAFPVIPTKPEPRPQPTVPSDSSAKLWGGKSLTDAIDHDK